MKATKEVVDVLKNARSLIEPRGKWIKGYEAKTHIGSPVHAENPRACKYCSVGALVRAYSDLEDAKLKTYRVAADFLEDVMVHPEDTFGTIPKINDLSTTKQQHVLMSFDFAILMAEDELKKGKK